MFVRFKRVPLSTQFGKTPSYSLHAVLVKNYRKKGKPRQRIIKYLCSARELELKNPEIRKAFFRLINKKLDQADLDARELAKIRVHLISFFVRNRSWK
jgi:hypothetical protein